MVLILDTAMDYDSIPPRGSGGSLGWCGQKEERRGRVGYRAQGGSLLLKLKRVLSGNRWSLDECFFSFIVWNRSLCFLGDFQWKFMLLCISMSVFDQLYKPAHCHVKMAFFHPASLSLSEKDCPSGDMTSIDFWNEGLFLPVFCFVFTFSFLMALKLKKNGFNCFLQNV